MKLRFRTDLRTLLWVLVLFPVATLIPYAHPRLLLWMLPLCAYIGFCAGVIAHNHNHCPTLHNRAANGAFAAWVSLFYGHPIFAWIPTHNLNHHKFLNRYGDASITWRYSKKNTWLLACTYFFVSAWWQQGLVKTFVQRVRSTDSRTYRQIKSQRRCFILGHAALLGVALLLHGMRLGTCVYLATFGASVAGGLWGMMFINFIQHVHCDPWSEHDHSRNFISKFENWLVFNSGFHTAHHEHPGAHWSRLPELHARIVDRIHPDLIQRSVFGFCVRSYLLGAASARFRTRQIGRPAYDAAA